MNYLSVRVLIVCKNIIFFCFENITIHIIREIDKCFVKISTRWHLKRNVCENK